MPGDSDDHGRDREKHVETAPDGARVYRDGVMVELDVDPASAPVEATRCRECGAEPTVESIASHRLSASGYLHDDVRLECSECGHGWCLGIPLGDPHPSFYDDLTCGCGMIARVHRVRVVSPTNLKLHLKCPRCYTFFETHRYPDGDGVALVGDPAITGETEGAVPWGYIPDMVDRPDDSDDRSVTVGSKNPGGDNHP